MTSPSSHFTMFRQPAQRYQRAKGLKVKHVLQIAIVTVVLTWVAYELNQSRKPAGSQGQDGSADFRGTVQDSSLERRALKPEGEPRKTEREITTNTEDTTTKSSLQENVYGSRTEEDADDQRDRDVSDLDIERASDQDEKSEDDVQHDVGTDFEELRNEQERVEQEEVVESGKDGDTEQDGDSQSLKSEVTNSSTEGRADGDDHVASFVDGDKKTGKTTGATFMDAFNADSVLKHKLDKLDGEVDDTSRSHVDEKFDSATGALKETTEDSGGEVAEEKNIEQNEEEVSRKEDDEEALDISEVSAALGTQEQKQAPVQQQVGENEKPEGKHDTLSHMQEQEQEEKKQEEERVERKKSGDPQTEVNDTESNVQPQLKSEGAEVDISEKNGNQHESMESLKSVASGLDSSTQGSESENKSLVQPEEKDAHQIETDENSNSRVEKHSQEDDGAETVNTDASTRENSKQEDEAPKDEVLKQVTDSNAAGSGESDTKVEDQSAENSNNPDEEVTSTQEGEAQI